MQLQRQPIGLQLRIQSLFLVQILCFTQFIAPYRKCCPLLRSELLKVIERLGEVLLQKTLPECARAQVCDYINENVRPFHGRLCRLQPMLAQPYSCRPEAHSGGLEGQPEPGAQAYPVAHCQRRQYRGLGEAFKVLPLGLDKLVKAVQALQGAPQVPATSGHGIGRYRLPRRARHADAAVG
ncbi:hypothetical protein PPS11_25835 [Pseudomonas putida S11]|nr:hypothetical protein PPS11_25835 [Pseudomonas putida S11]